MKLSREEAETLAWIESSLEHVRAAGQDKIETLLDIVRTEVLGELGLSGRASDETRDQTES